MFSLFERTGLMKVTTIHDEVSSADLMTHSTPAEWYEQGVVYEENQNYVSAAVCFAKAHDTPAQKRMLGLEARQNAKKHNGEARREFLFNAGYHFVQSGPASFSDATECFTASGEDALVKQLLQKMGRSNPETKVTKIDGKKNPFAA